MSFATFLSGNAASCMGHVPVMKLPIDSLVPCNARHSNWKLKQMAASWGYRVDMRHGKPLRVIVKD